MNKKKILNILMIIILISLIMIPKVCCAAFSVEEELGGLDSFKGTSGDSAQFDSMVNNLVYGLQTIGSIVSVVVLVVLGIKYMCGSIEERADYKKTMVPYVIGAIMVFSISTITGLIYNVAKNVI